MKSAQKSAKNPTKDLPSSIKIIFEDKDILVISKPPGIVNKATSVKGETIQDWMEEKLAKSEIEDSGVKNGTESWQELVPEDFDGEYGSPEEIFKERIGMVHRLDKNTSGVMILAKNPGSLVNLLAQFRNRTVQKKYTCLTHGKFRVPEGIIIAPLGRSSHDRKKFAVTIDGRDAETHYRVVKEYPGFTPKQIKEILLNADESKVKKLDRSLNKKMKHVYEQGFSLVECFPKTGRTHQIRVHMLHWQHPLVGDVNYVGRKRSKFDPLWCPRHFLHASEISFDHPRSGERVTLENELSEDLVEVIDLLF